MSDYVILIRILIAASVILAFIGMACLTRPHRPRNTRRVPRAESGNTVPRQPNVRRAPVPNAAELDAVCGAGFTARVNASWDDVTVASPRGES